MAYGQPDGMPMQTGAQAAGSGLGEMLRPRGPYGMAGHLAPADLGPRRFGGPFQNYGGFQNYLAGHPGLGAMMHGANFPAHPMDGRPMLNGLPNFQQMQPQIPLAMQQQQQVQALPPGPAPVNPQLPPQLPGVG